MDAAPCPVHRSETEYDFLEDQADAIAQTVGYHRNDFPFSAIWFSPREHADIQKSIATPFRPASGVGLGALDQLPLELLHDVVLRLDMHSLFLFRQANLRSRQTVDSLQQYQMVVSHGLNLFCALLRLSLATGVSLLDFYKALCTKACRLCGAFGGYMSLLLWERCCFNCCNSLAPETRVGHLFNVQRQFPLSKAQLTQLKVIKAFPAAYGDTPRFLRNHRFMMASPLQAFLLLGGRRDEFKTMEVWWNPNWNRMGSCALPYFDCPTGKVEHGISCAGCQLAVEKRVLGDMNERWLVEAREKLYAQDGFLEHFRWCKHAQLLWESSCGGTRQPAELPLFVQRGGHFIPRE